MIASLNGTVVRRRPGEVVIECGGVGYLLAVSAQTLASVPATGKQATLQTRLVVRDDQMQLYGFASEEEHNLFGLLVGVQSVGPKVALAVLSGGSPRELVNAIASEDSARFQTVPGIGKRTAERIIVELKEKVAGETGDEIVVLRASDEPRSLAREGLVGLGYSPQEADELLDSAEGDSAEGLIASALKAAR